MMEVIMKDQGNRPEYLSAAKLMKEKRVGGYNMMEENEWDKKRNGGEDLWWMELISLRHSVYDR